MNNADSYAMVQVYSFRIKYVKMNRRGVQSMQTTEETAKEIIESISEDTSELHRFIDFVKIYAIALKIAFRCDRAASWELLGVFLKELEKIGMYRRKYDKRLDEVALKIKTSSGGEPLNKRLEIIMAEASKLKEELEKYHTELAKVTEKKFGAKKRKRI